jgi:hypothetical protein
MPARLVVTSVTRKCTMEMCEPCIFTVTAKYFLIHPPQIVVRHVVVTGPSRVGRRDPESWDTWKLRSPLEQGGGVRSRGTRGGTGALPCREVGSGAMGSVAAMEPSLTRSLSPILWDIRQRVVARPASCLGLELVRRGTRSIGYRQAMLSK